MSCVESPPPFFLTAFFLYEKPNVYENRFITHNDRGSRMRMQEVENIPETLIYISRGRIVSIIKYSILRSLNY